MTLNLPDHVVPVGYLYVGKASYFMAIPKLEDARWLPLLQREDPVYFDGWVRKLSEEESHLLQQPKVVWMIMR